MSTISKESLISQLKWRYATKRFDATKKIPDSDWQALENALILTASSYGLQPWKFLVITDAATKEKLTPASWNQTQTADCSHFVVFAAKTGLDEAYIDKFIDETVKARGGQKDVHSRYRNMMVGDLVTGGRSKVITEWAARQVYIALGNLMTSAALLGIDTCPMEGIVPAKFDEILNLDPTGYKTVVACAVGYRHPEDKYAQAAKVRFDRSTLIHTI